MHDSVVGAVDDAVGGAKADIGPRPNSQPRRCVGRSDGNGSERVKENWSLEQVSEVVSSLYVLKLRCHLDRSGCCLWVNTFLSHFHRADVQQPCAHRESEDNKSEASYGEMNCCGHVQRCGGAAQRRVKRRAALRSVRLNVVFEMAA